MSFLWMQISQSANYRNSFAKVKKWLIRWHTPKDKVKKSVMFRSFVPTDRKISPQTSPFLSLLPIDLFVLHNLRYFCHSLQALFCVRIFRCLPFLVYCCVFYGWIFYRQANILFLSSREKHLGDSCQEGKGWSWQINFM